MNYLAHAWPLMQGGSPDPYELAGVAVPDWLSVAAKKTKCRSRDAAPHRGSSDPRLAALAQGVCRHHADDGWFHDSPAFGELSLGFAKTLRESLHEATSMRPWFLGHVLVELLLDDELAKRTPGLLDAYYEAIAEVDAERVAEGIHRMCGRDVGRLAHFVDRYVEMRFLADYRDDTRLTKRLNQVMSRVRLGELPEAFTELLPGFRREVAASFEALLLGKKDAQLETVASRSA